MTEPSQQARSFAAIALSIPGSDSDPFLADVLAGREDANRVVQAFAAFEAQIRAQYETPDAESVGRQAASKQLRRRAAELRTVAGRIKAQWHEADAEMVANELDRQAKALAKDASND